jgi:hypothetical protein
MPNPTLFKIRPMKPMTKSNTDKNSTNVLDLRRKSQPSISNLIPNLILSKIRLMKPMTKSNTDKSLAKALGLQRKP